MIRTRVCGNCAFNAPHSTLTDRVECHCNPPIMGMNGWPHVGRDQWCGSHLLLTGTVTVDLEPAPPKSPAQTGSVEPVAPKKAKKK